MNAKNRTIAVLKYINSIESAKSRYINNASENIVCTIYYIYKDIIRELSPGHHVLKKASYPRDRIQPIASKFHFNLVIAHKAKNAYYPSKKEKKIINVALFNYNATEYNNSKLKDLVDLAQHYMEKFK